MNIVKSQNSFNPVILLISGIFACCGTPSNLKTNVTLEQSNDFIREAFDIKIPEDQIPNVTFNKKSEPFVTILNSDYSQEINSVELHWKCIIFREYWTNALTREDTSMYIRVLDSMNTFTDDTLKVVLTELMKPWLIKTPNPLIKQDSTHQSSVAHLADTIHKHIIQTIYPKDNKAIVDYSTPGYRWGFERYYLKKDKGIWRIYRFQNVDTLD